MAVLLVSQFQVLSSRPFLLRQHTGTVDLIGAPELDIAASIFKCSGQFYL